MDRAWFRQTIEDSSICSKAIVSTISYGVQFAYKYLKLFYKETYEQIWLTIITNDYIYWSDSWKLYFPSIFATTNLSLMYVCYDIL